MSTILKLLAGFVITTCCVEASFLSNITKVASKFGKNTNFIDIAKEYRKSCESFEVITEDGYILTLFHIPGDPEKPVLLMHGYQCSSDSFIIRGEKSLALTLAEKGYDVWVGNNRGNRYGRKHRERDPDTDKQFWEFSFHEMGCYDLPAIIDFVLCKTGQKTLSAIGHSEGTTIFFVMGSMKPEYNKKVRIFIALAAAAYLSNTKGVLATILKIPPKAIDTILKAFDMEEVLGYDSVELSFIRVLCSVPVLGYDICVKTLFFATMGSNPDDFESKFTTTFLDYNPAGSSRQNTIHLLQIGHRKSFSMYDYGSSKNKKVYGTPAPPDYQLSNVTMDIALYAGKNDYCCTIKDIEHTKDQLENVVEFYIVEKDNWNHPDFIVGRTMDKNLYPALLSRLAKYN